MLNSHQSAKLLETAARIFPGGVNSPEQSFGAVGGSPFVVSRANGACLYDIDGRAYIDYAGSRGPLVLGHAHPLVVEALARQAASGTVYGACAEQELELAELIRQHMPSLEMLRFVNSGTEACMSVLRLARAFTRREKVLMFNGCRHGHADSLLAAAGSDFSAPAAPVSAGVPVDFLRSTMVAKYNNFYDLGEVFSLYGDEIAAVIVEPVMGNAGVIPPLPGFLKTLRQLCTEFGCLLIFDEVMTGFRAATGGAQALYGVIPDLTMLGKAIGGGLPIGAFGGRREIMQQLAPLGPVYQAGTFSGNPLSMTAGAVSLREWTKPAVFSAAAAAAHKLSDAVKRLAGTHGLPVCALSIGTMFSIFFRGTPPADYAQAQAADSGLFRRFFDLALAKGVFFPPSPFETSFVSTAHHEAIIEETVDRLSLVFAELAESIRQGAPVMSGV